ncbi:M949_RS01915 family surface polysaccharide biosynthesis protein [Variovorax sp. VaC1]|uniref:M949_RS01915 family surface polysaccharide biosynthesis protein n=1 Tax=Variovorax sp. VaC1 TaxID=3373132 RepID=UPI00374A009F
MKLKKILAFASLSLLAAGSSAQTAEAGKNECPANAPYLGAEALKAAGFELPVFKRYCYTDKSGSYALLLGEKQDRPFHSEQLSSTLQAALYKVDGDKVLTRQWAIRDFAGKDDGGINFRSKLIELSDIDGDGLVDPILVYRFYPLVDTDSISTDDFSGGIKIVTFHRGRKATIHAITGDLDGDRKTTANSNYFALPKVARQHLVRKMAAMYKAGQFGFDNSYDFVPKREVSGR